MSTDSDSLLTQYQWTPQPVAAAIVHELVTQFCASNSAARQLATRMRDETGTRFVDWVDHISIALPVDIVSRNDAATDAESLSENSLGNPSVYRDWMAASFEATAIDGDECYVHRGGIFPTLMTNYDGSTRLAILVESVADFAAVHGLTHIEGDPLAAYRRALVAKENDTEFYVIERHGYTGFRTQVVAPEYMAMLERHRELFRTRRRSAATDGAAFLYTEQLIGDAIADLGQSRVCDLFFSTEREYWQRRNHAARIQYARQAALGLGWGNDDHHTYRSSRHHFKSLIALFEQLGFYCRERFYAGRAAGWGAQVLEHPTTEIVIFADVDLSPDELRVDFSHDGLEPRETLGTIGLWCALHGESMLEAGMHHLECTFDYTLLRQQLTEARIETMDPFTSFSYLKQAFTRGEVWPVRTDRIDQLLTAGRISHEQAEQFRVHGAIGSHLENLERNDGFKGFNQDGVSEIITDTDPRRHLIHSGI